MALELVNRLPYDHPYRWDGTTVGGVKLWRPDELGASLALWLDAEDTDSITLNGSNVSQWDDKSGNGNHVSNATAATQPAYLTTGWNGKPTLSFTETGLEFLFKDGVSNFAANEDFTLAGAFEFLQTSRQWDLIAGWRSAPNSNASPHQGTPILQGMSTAQEIGYHHTDKADTRIAVGVTTRLGKKIATIGRSGGTNGDGGAATATSTGFSQPTYITNTTQGFSSEAATGFQVGGRQQSATQYGNKYIAEVVGCNTKLSTADRQKLEGYLAWKWGLEADLPISHPYKLTPPYTGSPVYDPDAQTYFNRVEGPAGDNQTLEASVKTAINNFVLGCKADGIWDAIKSSAILAGARTLSGALQPLAGTAPTNFNFVSGDYNRKTGLVGNGSTKYLNSNRAGNTEALNNQHLSVYVDTAATATNAYIGLGGDTGIYRNTGLNAIDVRSRNSSGGAAGSINSIGFMGISRNNASNFDARVDGNTVIINSASSILNAQNTTVFAREAGTSLLADARIAFYSIGESINLAALDTRVSALMTALDGAIA